MTNMSSFSHVMSSTRSQDAYATSRGAAGFVTRLMAVQFGGRGVRVNALCPSPIDTEHVRRNFPDEAAWITGQAILLGGGISCPYP